MNPAPIALLIEDDEDARTALASLLRHHGINVVSVRSGREGLRELRAGIAARVILLDHMMSQDDGAAFRRAQRADAELAAIPVIVFSAPDRRGDGADAKPAATPTDFERLLLAIQWHCGRPPVVDYST
jgi:CheY-like chemotaxis protein